MIQGLKNILSFDEFKMILEEGEGYRIEFKENYYSNMDKELVAFANASGGRIFIGVTDSGRAQGVEITNKLKSQIQDLANNCEPSIKIKMEEIENILIVNVFEGMDKPYKCGSGFYNRVGPNSQKMNRNDIIEFVKAEGKIRFDEMICRRFEYDEHFDEKKLNRFLKIAGISKVLENKFILKNLDVATIDSTREIIMSNVGALFFSKNLDDIYFHTMVTCALFKGKEKHTILDRRDFNEDIVSSVDYAMNFLKNYIPVRYKFTGEPQRVEIPEIPYEALREGVINAIIHRDYFQKGANVMIEIYDDRIEIVSPGGLVKGLSPENFGEKSVLRNPNIADLFQRINYIEKMGTGIKRMQNMMSAAGLPLIKFDFSELFVTATFYRSGLRAESGIESGLSRDQVKILSNCLNEVTILELMEIFDRTNRTKFRDQVIKPLIDAGWIEMTIPDKPTSSKQKYRITEKGRQLLQNAR